MSQANIEAIAAGFTDQLNYTKKTRWKDTKSQPYNKDEDQSL